MLNVQKRSKATFKNHMQTLQTLVPTTLKPTLEHCNPKTQTLSRQWDRRDPPAQHFSPMQLADPTWKILARAIGGTL